MKLLGFDTETTGKWDFKSPADAPNQPGIVQLAAILWDLDEETLVAKKVGEFSCIVKPGQDYMSIEPGAQAIHGISLDIANRCGINLKVAMGIFRAYLAQADAVFCHNYQFDSRLVIRSFGKSGMDVYMKDWKSYCTMTAPEACAFVGIPQGQGYKWPKLIELHEKLFNTGFSGAHDAMGDIIATSNCLFEMLRRGILCL